MQLKKIKFGATQPVLRGFVADRDCELTDWQVGLGGLGGVENQVGNFKKLKDLSPENQHDNGTSTMNKDLFPIEHGDFPMSC